MPAKLTECSWYLKYHDGKELRINYAAGMEEPLRIGITDPEAGTTSVPLDKQSVIAMLHHLNAVLEIL